MQHHQQAAFLRIEPALHTAGLHPACAEIGERNSGNTSQQNRRHSVNKRLISLALVLLLSLAAFPAAAMAGGEGST